MLWKFIALVIVTNLVLLGCNYVLLLNGIVLGYWYFALAIIVSLGEAVWIIARNKRMTASW